MSPLGLLLAGLVGSAHCAGMCGGFAAGVCAGDRPHARLAAWQLGRGVTYVVLGALAGWLGGRVDGLVEQLLGLQVFVGPAVGVLLILMAVRELGWLPRRAQVVQIEDPNRRTSALTTLLRRARDGGVHPAAALGLGVGLLPCGWLWAALAVAAATQGLLAGALSMGAFWLGTVPILTAIGGTSGLFAGRTRGWARPVLVVALLLGGLLSMTGHLMVEPPSPAQATPVCHG